MRANKTLNKKAKEEMEMRVTLVRRVNRRPDYQVRNGPEQIVEMQVTVRYMRCIEKRMAALKPGPGEGGTV